MKFVDSNFEIIPQGVGLDGLYKHVEKVARVSYKSEDKITEDSAKRMVDTLIKNQHLACLEHGTIYLSRNFEFGGQDYINFYKKYDKNPYSRINIEYTKDQNAGARILHVTTNARVIIENHWEQDLQYMCEPTEFHEKRYTVKFICSAGIGREFTRHRTFSFMQESSRYINYSKGKFNSELTFIIPQWIYDVQTAEADCIDCPTNERKIWLMNLHGEDLINQLSCEDRTVSSYIDLLKHIERDYMFYTNTEESYKLKAQEARGILPLDIKSELVMTGFISDWIHFFRLRSHIAITGKPHPDAQYLADNVLQEFIDRKYCIYEEVKQTDRCD